MNTNLISILCGTLVALVAIIAATAAAIIGTIDGASFSAIIGAAIGGVSVAGGHAMIAGVNGKKTNGPPADQTIESTTTTKTSTPPKGGTP